MTHGAGVSRNRIEVARPVPGRWLSSVGQSEG